MDEIQKNTLRRALGALGFRIERTQHHKFSYEASNYPKTRRAGNPVIFDVGANIGQSALWYAASFPTAKIFAFEPLPTVFARLERSVAHCARIYPRECALGARPGIVRTPLITSDSIQTVAVLRQDAGRTRRADGHEIRVSTVDDVAAAESIDRIDILKTDTEGYDLDVLKGASRMLAERRIQAVLSEATFRDEDTSHTNFFDLKSFLGEQGFRFHSLFARFRTLLGRPRSGESRRVPREGCGNGRDGPEHCADTLISWRGGHLGMRRGADVP